MGRYQACIKRCLALQPKSVALAAGGMPFVYFGPNFLLQYVGSAKKIRPSATGRLSTLVMHTSSPSDQWDDRRIDIARGGPPSRRLRGWGWHGLCLASRGCCGGLAECHEFPRHYKHAVHVLADHGSAINSPIL